MIPPQGWNLAPRSPQGSNGGLVFWGPRMAGRAGRLLSGGRGLPEQRIQDGRPGRIGPTEGLQRATP